MTTPNSLYALLDWFTEHEIWWDEEALDVVHLTDGATSLVRASARHSPTLPTVPPEGLLVSGTGMGVVARRRLEEEEVVVRIPKSAVLSPKSSGIANIIEDEELAGGIALTLSVMFELARGPHSPWYGYLNSLPRKVYIPVLWQPRQLALLEGTDLARDLINDREELASDYQELILPIVTNHPDVFTPPEAFTFDRFLQVTSVVTSRAFQVDNYHGDAMVPFADLFNHLTGGEHVHIEAEADVCVVCGESGGCEHTIAEDDDEETDAESGVKEVSDNDSDTCMEAVPLDDPSVMISGPPTGRATDGNDSDNESFESVEEDAMDMRVYRPVQAGHEVFNTYGVHSAAYLLHRYGFADHHNPQDVVTIEFPALAALAERQANTLPADHRRRVANLYLRHHPVFLISERLDGLESSREEEEETLNFFSIAHEGTLDARLLLVLLLLHHGDAELGDLEAKPKAAHRYFTALLQWLAKLGPTLLASSGARPRPAKARRTVTSKRTTGRIAAATSTCPMAARALDLVKTHPEILAAAFTNLLELIQERAARHMSDKEFRDLEPQDDAQDRLCYEHARTLRDSELATLARAQARYQRYLAELA
ncbi:hypothetical protein IWQ60_005201 [Tieghemiomyces parasiticus]|uniref:SET domain-containing protein n=1 Tax=Tieghemiomyces parasiticus TaxID=78921 RepID=A0A9W8ACU1_9FUNG|nr:hypothetical protein IWQ60_005201 [Tieghemiomyces parasiticus]